MPYILRPIDVEVFTYQRQPRAEWPAWLLDFQANTNTSGKVGACIDAIGSLMIPNGSAFDIARVGDYVVKEGSAIKVYRAAAFEDRFEFVED